ncbi:siderophore-interacting protein [Actinospica robiniae]|nr:siderophore-interacting protein [Actinospica robiniae]
MLRGEPASPSMRRVTVGGRSLTDLAYLGYDHWFRLFMRPAM